MYSESALSNRLKRTFEASATYETEIENLCDDDLIILDDMGSTNITEWKKDVLLKFLDYRYTSRKPTVITSNLNEIQIKKDLGYRVFSRLFAKENTILNYGSEDLRSLGH